MELPFTGKEDYRESRFGRVYGERSGVWFWKCLIWDVYSHGNVGVKYMWNLVFLEDIWARYQSGNAYENHETERDYLGSEYK